jgi:hypothetical protein
MILNFKNTKLRKQLLYGMTLVPWIKGQPLVWEVTIVDTLADSCVLKTSEVSGFAAEMACQHKHSKYL